MSDINPSIINTNLVLYYDFANVKSYAGSGTSVVDISKSGNNGVLQNGPTFASNLCSLDGVNDYIYTPLGLPSPSTTPTTFEIVFKNNSNSAFKGLIGRSNYLSNGFSVGFTSQSYIGYTVSGAGVAAENAYTYNSSVISHGTFVFNGRNITLYRNGINIGSASIAFDIVAAGSPIYIGTIGQGGWGSSVVDISLVRVYTAALSPTQVQQNYNALKGRYGL